MKTSIWRWALLLLLMLCLAASAAVAQTTPDIPRSPRADSATVPTDTSALAKRVKASKPIVLTDTSLDPFKEAPITFAPSPRRAALYSAVFPGLGQIYNRKYWKLPIIYAGAAAVVYAFNFNDREYQKFREAYILRRNGDNTTSSLANLYPDINQLSNARDFYRYYRDFSVILGILLYGMQLADAAVDAHLSTFSVKDDLKVTLGPAMLPQVTGHQIPGFSASFTFRTTKSRPSAPLYSAIPK